MAKMRLYKFWNENGDEKEKEALSLKKAVMSVQGDYKDKVIGVEYVSKKGKQISTSVNLLTSFVTTLRPKFKSKSL